MNLFVAAIYLDSYPLVDEIIDQVIQNITHMGSMYSSIFGCAMKTTVNIAALRFLGFFMRNQFITYRNGHSEVVDLLISDRWAPYNVACWHRRSDPIDKALLTPKIPIFNKIIEFRKRFFYEAIPLEVLEHTARNCIILKNQGMLEMLGWLLHNQLREASMNFYPSAVKLASHLGKIDPLQLLLNLAPPNLDFPGFIVLAARRGSFQCVKVLLEHKQAVGEQPQGWGSPQSPLPSAIVSSIALEHTRLFHLLCKFQAEADRDGTHKLAGHCAESEELHSMAGLVETTTYPNGD
ncbi:hypothetical protein BT63DRAFT_128625 [Microthyrium microscopicum]|uniref:Ankyrin n=1 Tax=Microthyrium microscopicum TaxID=703497 RepID=A0A6A6TW25_9PEZI|nr:hypothetical protein BT63DRAFT_128625 [Microthyrium microscopicum]